MILSRAHKSYTKETIPICYLVLCRKYAPLDCDNVCKVDFWFLQLITCSNQAILRYPLPVPDTRVFGNSSTRYPGIKIGGYLQSLAPHDKVGGLCPKLFEGQPLDQVWIRIAIRGITQSPGGSF